MKLSNRTQDVKLTIKYNPSRPLTQESLNKRVALELTTKWGARYSMKGDK
jgi:hypothetical protein